MLPLNVGTSSLGNLRPVDSEEVWVEELEVGADDFASSSFTLREQSMKKLFQLSLLRHQFVRVFQVQRYQLRLYGREIFLAVSYLFLV